MHKELSIENFKCFSKKTRIKLGKINICLGSNSVGKSSVIQSCILLRQIYEQAMVYRNTKVDEYTIQLNDVYGLQLGDSKHIQSANK
ncbi:MAG: AAA family ATPase, partial [Agathobacter sp.]|nr:AAA family ATPase [Agathobacter sp.]